VTKAPLITIVDDDASIRAALEELVGSLGWRTCTFPSADSFLRSPLLAETRCLILDVQMPSMSGLELQQHLARLGFDIPIIFITAYPDEAAKSQALKAGAVGFLYKPMDLNERRLVDCLHAALSKRSDPDREP
jgi:FixJ family two-component response regulator